MRSKTKPHYVGREYRRTGVQAVNPSAFGEVFAIQVGPRENIVVDGLAIVDVFGPTTSSPEGLLDSYPEIVARVEDAATSPDVSAIVLRINSPGGDFAGACEASREIRQIALEAGKPLYTQYERQGCSAGYAIGSAATHGSRAAPSAEVGSVGLVATRIDMTQANLNAGAVVTLTTSGSKKAYGNVAVAMSETERRDTQHSINQLSQVFFQLVADHRGIPVEVVQAWEAGVFSGAEAIAAGLVDAIESFDAHAFVAGAASEGTAMTITEAREALAKLAQSEDAAERAAALKALKALESQDDEEKPDDEDKDDETGAVTPAPGAARLAASVAPTVDADLAQLVQRLSTEVTELRASRENEQRSALLASRSDLAPEVVSLLQKKSYAEAVEWVNAIPPKAASKLEAAAKSPTEKATVSAARAQAAGASVAAVAPSGNEELNRIFKLTANRDTSAPAAANVMRFGARKAK